MESTLAELACVFMVIHTARSANIPLNSSNHEVAAPVGGTAVLPCHLQTFGKTTKNLETVLWKKKNGTQEIVVLFYSTNNQLMNQSKAYRGRTTMSEQWLTHGEGNLIMKKITLDDAGEYSCWTKESSVGPLSEHKCCSMNLYVEQRMSGKQQQLIISWTLYLLSLSLCLLILYRCGSQLTHTA
ncbi:butyrophilin subfamily 3 member A2-like [Pyxicephalus adspersus]|uniref:butyrophilin subfamily 3 member A2-like n=1 Tax=Pyxicephalus adspersus TaxID=30357 RepID=UPI003B5A111B